jgi:hypothetical protein
MEQLKQNEITSNQNLITTPITNTIINDMNSTIINDTNNKKEECELIGPNKTTAINDGDSISNEASNILSWIVANDIDKVIGVNAYTGQTITFDNIIAKLRKGGLNQEADTLVSKRNPISKLLAPLSDNTKKAGISPFVLLALAGAGIYFFTRKK